MIRTLAAITISLLAAGSVAAQALIIVDLTHRAHNLTQAEVAALPQVSLPVKTKDGQTHVFSGPSLAAILKIAGAPSGADLRGKDLADVVVVSARDGYRVALSLAETDPALGGKKIVVADRVDGKAIGPEDGPFRLIVAGDTRAARWARMVRQIAVIQLGETSQTATSP